MDPAQSREGNRSTWLHHYTKTKYLTLICIKNALFAVLWLHTHLVESLGTSRKMLTRFGIEFNFSASLDSKAILYGKAYIYLKQDYFD